MSKNKDLVGSDSWDNIWNQSSMLKYSIIEKHLAINRKWDSLFKKYLEKDDNKKILEIGCAGAKRLIYFARKFGYQVYGIDYSKEGVELAKENLKVAGVEGTVLCEDIFNTSFEEESFDVVYSMGLIEHFENPAEIVDAHIRLLKDRGKLIITMPNLRGSLSFTLSRITGRDKRLLETHNLNTMDREVISGLLKGKGIKTLSLDYFGPVDLSAAFSNIRFKPLLYLMHLVNQVFGYATYYMPKSRYFSPYIVLIAEKDKEYIYDA